MANITWNILVDWNNDGTLEGNEKTYFRDIYIKRGKDFFLEKAGGGFYHTDVGECNILLDNQSWRYSPLNSSSPLYPNVKPGRKVTVRANYNSVDYDIFTGFIQDIVPSGTVERTVSIKVLDSLQWLKEQKNVKIEAQIAKTAKDCLSLGLAAAGWIEAKQGVFDFESLGEYQDYFWLADADLYNSVMEFVDAHLGRLFVSGDGKLHFHSRNRNPSSAHTFTESEVSKDINLVMPWHTIRNVIDVWCYPLSIGSEGILWQLSEPYYIKASETVVWDIKYQANGKDCGGLDIVTLVASDDYWASSTLDVWGFEETGNLSVSVAYHATGARYTITNTISTRGFWILWFRQRGKPLYFGQPQLISVSDATSITAYQAKKFVLDVPMLHDANWAANLASFLLGILKVPREYPKITLINQPALIFGADLGVRHTLNFPTIGVSSVLYELAGIEIKLDNQMPNVPVATFTYELPYRTGGTYWTFSTNIGTNSYFAF